jgi:hypothetical protein
MATISISQEEFNRLQAKVSDLEEKVMVLAEQSSNGGIMKTASKNAKKFEFGAAKGLVVYIADDFDAPLEDFKDYM